MAIPIVADTTKEVAARYGVLLERAGIALRWGGLVGPVGWGGYWFQGFVCWGFVWLRTVRGAVPGLGWGAPGGRV
jgi:hypothetical protein